MLVLCDCVYWQNLADLPVFLCKFACFDCFYVLVLVSVDGRILVIFSLFLAKMSSITRILPINTVKFSKISQ